MPSPAPAALVVKKGSDRWLGASLLRPAPLSTISMAMSGPAASSRRGTRGAGSPSLEAKTPEGVVKVHLGAMRYLMEDFNPKAGSAVVARGFKINAGVAAAPWNYRR